MEKIVFTTHFRKKTAFKLAKKLVKKDLAACVQVSKISRSFFKWQGKFQDCGEWLIAIKTDKKFKKLNKFIRKNHSYELPEIISLPIKNIDKKYKKWLKGKKNEAN